MKKVGIITLCSNNNFGNKLQNYGLKKHLEKQNLEVETIWVANAFESNNIKAYFKYIRNIFYDLFNYGRNKYFIEFNKKYLNIAKKKLILNDDLSKIDKNYDNLIVGSDQVWNYQFVGNFNIYFMLNVEKKKCSSYAASIGVEKISDELKDKYKISFNHMQNISVREDSGKQIIEELSARTDVEVLIDPTMLLTDKEWDKVSKKPKMLDSEKFILNYFLGELSEERKKEIEKVAEENNCEIINILDKNSPFYECGPSEFLYLEKNAFLICTDSFHSSVFAILYNRPFVIFEREQKGIASMNSRLDTLISKFNLKNRKYNGNNITKENLEHDYTEAYKILEKERKKSESFLKKALNIKDSD